MSKFSPHIWRAYDIRGNAETDITEEFAYRLGLALSLMCHERGAEEIAVAHDARVTSVELHTALIKGLVEGGLEVYNIGQAPTPAMYFAVDALGLDAGIIVTASHNPRTDNGFKLRFNGSSVLSKEINHLRALFESAQKPTCSPGFCQDFPVQDTYLAAIARDCHPPKGTYKVVIDAGNGVAGPWALDLFQRMGVETIPLFCTPDGTFPNHQPDPTKPGNMIELQKQVKEHQATLGIGLDGDGDRVAVVTAKGKLLFGDRLMAIFAKDMLRWKYGGVVYDVKCSMMLDEVVKKAGGFTVMSPTGYPWIQKNMKDNAALLGGEQSSHICFADRWFGFDDGLYAAARLLSLATELDKQNDALPVYPCTPELRLPIEETAKLQIITTLRQRFHGFDIQNLDGLRCHNDDGWALIRPSNTEACLSVRIEGKNQKGLQNLANFLYQEFTNMGLYSPELKSFC